MRGKKIMQGNKVSDKAVIRLSLVPEVTTEIRDPAPLLLGPTRHVPSLTRFTPVSTRVGIYIAPAIQILARTVRCFVFLLSR